MLRDNTSPYQYIRGLRQVKEDEKEMFRQSHSLEVLTNHLHVKALLATLRAGLCSDQLPQTPAQSKARELCLPSQSKQVIQSAVLI